MKKIFSLFFVLSFVISLYGEIKSYTIEIVLHPDSFAFVPFGYRSDSIPEYVGYDMYCSKMTQEEKEAREYFAMSRDPYQRYSTYVPNGEPCREIFGVHVLLPIDFQSIDTVVYSVSDRKLFSIGYKFPNGSQPRYDEKGNILPKVMYPDSIYEEYITPDHPSRILRDNGFNTYLLKVCPFYFDAFKDEVYISSFQVTIYYEAGEVLWRPGNQSGWSVRLCYNFKDRDSLYNEEIFKELTGIKNNCYMHSVGTPMYDLQGRRVAHPKQGEIYIQKGKKIKK